MTKGDRLHELDQAASRLNTDNHVGYLSEAASVLQDPSVADEDAPLEALRLLQAMQGSPYAKGPDQKLALSDVGCWLERWLSNDPAIERQQLAWDVGWLKRLSRVAKAPQGRERRAGQPARFGSRLPQLERARGRSLESAGNATGRSSAGGSASPPPTPPQTPAELFVQRFPDLPKQPVPKQVEELIKLPGMLGGYEAAESAMPERWRDALPKVLPAALEALRQQADPSNLDETPSVEELQRRLDGLVKPNRKDRKGLKRYDKAKKHLENKIAQARSESSNATRKTEEARSFLNWLDGQPKDGASVEVAR